MKKTKVEFNVMVSITLSNIICFIFGGEGGDLYSYHKIWYLVSCNIILGITLKVMLHNTICNNNF